ncbi:MAG TPA: pilus assembly protein PilM [Candidatus Methylomirabilis sp.]|nr:pilus assembly protein PilM [Candidatus Methylomirabilis sp.]
MSSAATFHRGIYKSGLVRRVARWLDAAPHPPLAIEIGLDGVSGARWTRTGGLDTYGVEALAPGSLTPSAVEANITNATALKAAVASVCNRLRAKEESVALILPDPVIRVFVQHFDEFPRSPEEAEPMLRWKLKKSVPFEVDETLISYMRQAPRESGVDVVTALARLRIVREYESLLESAGLHPGVVLSASLAAISLVDESRPTLLARVSGVSLTTAIVRDGVLCGYRCTELPARGADLTPPMLLEEIFPVAAYYQDTWKEGIQSVRVAGLGARLPEFVRPLELEFHCEVRSLLHAGVSDGRIPSDARPLADRELDGLVGWMLQRG